MGLQDTFENLVREGVAKFHLAVFGSGVLFVLLSFFDLQNGLSPRISPMWPMFLVGTALIVLSVILYRIDAVVSGPQETKRPILTTALDISDKDAVVKAFDVMDGTQQDIMRCMYKLHRREIPIDDLYPEFAREYPGQIAREKELLYRVRDIEHKGLMRTKSLGEKNTMAIIPEEIESILEDATPARLQS